MWAIVQGITYESSFDALAARAVPEGGFSDSPGATYRVDATAWAIIALDRARRCIPILDQACARLANDQSEDGRLSVSPQHFEAFWPTALAVLAWHRFAAYRKSRTRAMQFLLSTTGVHFRKDSENPLGHDPTIKGWPWVAGTHSWIEPTALSIIAIDTCGFGNHDRVHEAVRLLVDRQLPHGGWNCGNKSVFGQELRPDPESTGAALHALERRVSRSEIQRSLDYLVERIQNLQTPLALGWSLLGLGAWGLLPSNASRLVERCLNRQERFGPYETSALCLLLCSASSPRGLYPEV